MRYTADPLLKVGLRPDYTKDFDSLLNAVSSASVQSNSYWEANNGGIRYTGHIAVGSLAAVDTSPPLTGVTGTTVATVMNSDTLTDGSNAQNALIFNAMIVDASANNASNWIVQDGILEIKSGNNKNYTGLVVGDGGAVYHYGTGTVSEADGIFALTENNSSGNITIAQDVRALQINYGSGTVATHYGLSSYLIQVSGTTTVTRNEGLHIYDPLIIAGSVGTTYGISIAGQTVGTTNNYGIAVGASATNTLWVSSDSDSTTAAGGIVFGVSKDTNLYRSAANTLKTDDGLVIGLNQSFVKEVAHTISVEASTTAATAGAALSIAAGAGSATTSGVGGALNLNAGSAQAGNSLGGAVTITGGTASGVVAGGGVTIAGGSGWVGGSIKIDVGGGFASATLQIGSKTATPTGFGVAPTAVVHIKAGTTAASSAPLKFNTGTNMTTAEVGAMEFTTGRLYFTPVLTRNIVTATVDTDTTAVGNVTTGEDDLITYSVPANTMGTNGDYISFRASGTIANSINAKRLRVKYGGTTVMDTGAAGIPVSTAIQWVVEGEIIRTGATTQKCNASLTTNNATLATYSGYSTAAETLSGAVTLKLTGEATSTDDIIQETFTARLN